MDIGSWGGASAGRGLDTSTWRGAKHERRNTANVTATVVLEKSQGTTKTLAIDLAWEGGALIYVRVRRRSGGSTIEITRNPLTPINTERSKT